MKKYYITIALLFLFIIGFSQNAILCPIFSDYITIEDTNNVPTITNNGDGTITLNSQEQYITDIFANYIIYNFGRSFPDINTGPVSKLYTIFYQNKDLINELGTSVPPEIFSIESNYSSTSINSEIISFLDGKKFNLKKYIATSDADGCYDCTLNDVPNDFNLIVEFNYDSINDLLLMNSFGLTPCGNSFSIALKGGSDFNGQITENTLQLWESTPETIIETSTCSFIENDLYSLLGISCNNINSGNITITIDTVANTLLFHRTNIIFGYHEMFFEESQLSISEFPLNNLKVYETESNPYLQIFNSNNNQLYVEIYSISGQLVLEKIPFSENKILINQLSNNLYFVKVSNSQNLFKIFKFLKR